MIFKTFNFFTVQSVNYLSDNMCTKPKYCHIKELEWTILCFFLKDLQDRQFLENGILLKYHFPLGEQFPSPYIVKMIVSRR